jgi:hypothetical protein
MDSPQSARSLRDAAVKTADAAGAKALVQEVSRGLDHFADQIWCLGLGATSDERRALGLVAQMAADLILGAATMFDLGHLYAGSSLVRQLIEADYLLFLFGIDRDEGTRWLNGTADDHRRLFQPAAMRSRSDGRFDVDEYARHCEMGGHPRPAARSLVDRHHLVSADPSALLWADLAGHTARVWDHYKVAALTCSPTNVYPDRWAPLDALCLGWWEASRAHRALVARIGVVVGDVVASSERPNVDKPSER